MRIAISLPLTVALLACSGVCKVHAKSNPDLSQIRLSALEFNQTDLGTALDYLREKANELLGPGASPANLILIDPDNNLSEKTVSLKLKKIPNEIDINKARLDEVTEYLAALSEGATTSGPAPPPLNFLIKENTTRPVAERFVSLKLNRASLADVLHYATGLAECRFRVDRFLPPIVV